MLTGGFKGQMDTRTELTCEQCEGRFEPKSRNRHRIPTRFCSKACSIRWHNTQRLQGAALLKRKKRAIPRPRKLSIKTLDELAASEGLPVGCYPPGALGLLRRRRSVADRIPAVERPALLFEVAKRMGLTDEGPMLMSARLAAQHSALSTQRCAPVEVPACPI
jgi:hypothetical protein